MLILNTQIFKCVYLKLFKLTNLVRFQELCEQLIFFELFADSTYTVVWKMPYLFFLQILLISSIAFSPQEDLTWQVSIYFPPARDQQWKS
jgi:hypothetical protein